MTVQPTRDQLRDDVELGKALTGTYRADSHPDYYHAMDRVFETVPQLLDQLDRAEARIKAVRELADTAERIYATISGEGMAVDIRRALDT